MAANSRLATATHVLVLLAQARRAHRSSAQLAESVNTHPVLVRKLLGQLKAAGLVTVAPGRGGGVLLARAPSAITLCAVRAAVDGGRAFAPNPAPVNATCPTSRHIKQTLTPVLERVEASIDRELRGVRLSDVLASVVQAPRRSAAARI
jgi:Rrf2 family protein